MITFIGTGLLGSNFTRALITKGEEVRVWNRTYEKALALESTGAKIFRNIKEAVAGSHRIHLTLSDDASVDEVIALMTPALEKGVIVIDHTTTTAKGAMERTTSAAAAGFTYVHVPVFMGPSNALDSSGYMLISGDQEVVKTVTPWLSPMTGQLINFGEQTGKAAGLKLMGNLFLLSMVGGFSDMLTLGKALDIPPADLTTLFNAWNPGKGAPARLAKILSGQFDEPSWELQMARKDARLMIEEASSANSELLLVPSIAREMDAWLSDDNAKKDWTIFASRNR